MATYQSASHHRCALPEHCIVSSQTPPLPPACLCHDIIATPPRPWIQSDPGNEATTLECVRDDNIFNPPQHTNMISSTRINPSPSQSETEQEGPFFSLTPLLSPWLTSLFKFMKTQLSSEVTATFTDWTQIDVGGPGGGGLHTGLFHTFSHTKRCFIFFLKTHHKDVKF